MPGGEAASGCCNWSIRTICGKCTARITATAPRQYQHGHTPCATRFARSFGRVLNDDDLIVDIGSNDKHDLAGLPYRGAILVGVDPTGIMVAEHYPSHIPPDTGLLSARALQERFSGRRRRS